MIMLFLAAPKPRSVIPFLAAAKLLSHFPPLTSGVPTQFRHSERSLRSEEPLLADPPPILVAIILGPCQTPAKVPVYVVFPANQPHAFLQVPK